MIKRQNYKATKIFISSEILKVSKNKISQIINVLC